MSTVFTLWDTTNGRQEYGLSVLPDALQDDRTLFYLMLLIVAVIIALGANVLRSRVGRAWGRHPR